MDHRVPTFPLRAALAPLLFLLVTGCAAWGKQQGVENTWRAGDGPTLEAGVTTQAEVVQQLGPPSQIIGLEGQVIFYYVRERTAGRGLILIVYNHLTTKVDYDRAVFFFDDTGTLTSFSFSENELPVQGED